MQPDGALTTSGKSILVTGATGFLGSHLVARLIAGGHSVSVIERHHSLNSSAWTGKVERITGELEQVFNDPLLNISRFDWIFHLAGSASVPNSIVEPEADFRSLQALFVVLEALRRVKTERRPKLIFPSSGAVYGQPVVMPITEESPLGPLSPYGAGKLAGEEYIKVYSQLYGISSVRLRLFSVYGPELTKQVVYDFMNKLSSNPGEIELLGDGRQQRDFVYIDDVIDLMLLAANLKAEPGTSPVFNVASGTSTKIIDVARAVADIMGLHPRIRCTEEIRSGEPHTWLVDIARAKAIGFNPRVALKDGLKRVVCWYQNRLATANQL